MKNKELSNIYSVIFKVKDEVSEAYNPIPYQKNEHFSNKFYLPNLSLNNVKNEVLNYLQGNFDNPQNIEIIKITNLPESNRMKKWLSGYFQEMIGDMCPNG